jgi:Tetracyclin repressor-like, C-terminal domain
VIASITEDAAALVSTTVLGLVFARCVVGLEPLTSASSEELACTLALAFQQLLARPA